MHSARDVCKPHAATRGDGMCGMHSSPVHQRSAAVVQPQRQPLSCLTPMALRQSSHSHTRRDRVRRDIFGTDTTTSRIRMTIRFGAATTKLMCAKVSPEDEGLTYRDTYPGLCTAATLKEIAAQGWSLNLGRYLGAAPVEDVDNEDCEKHFEKV